MFRSWRFGKLFGIGVYVHWTFLLLLGWVLYSGLDEGLTAALATVALVVAVFGCVVLHEFGHALMARWYGIRTRDITLYPIGGVARLEGMSTNPVEELFIALAGPSVNVVLALLLVVVLAAMGFSHVLLFTDASGGPAGSGFLTSLLAANLMLAFFNLLPAFPMDGGRVLRSLLALRLGRLRATEIAARVGMAFAMLIALLPAVMYVAFGAWSPMPVLVGLFVFYAAQRELWVVRQAEAARLEEPLEVLPADGEDQAADPARDRRPTPLLVVTRVPRPGGAE
jgi:Zn-dependent protease